MQAPAGHWCSPVTATLMLILLIAVTSAIITFNVNRREENASFQRLASEAEEFASLLELNMDSDRRQLELIAALANDYIALDTSKLQAFLDQYPGNGNFFSRIEILLPGDLVLSANGKVTNAEGQLSFEKEAGLGAHISDRERDLNSENYVVRHFVPVSRSGEILAMLYGVIDIGTLGEELPYTPYGGSAAVYLIDGATGDFLIDTWHPEPGNIWESGSRPMAHGYNDVQLRRGLIEGESNYVVFLSNTTNDYLYFYYMPISINQWRVALSVPEEVVFADARSVRSMLNVMLILETIGFLFYLSWLIRYVRRETGEKQRQLDALNYIYDVEKLLFNAHVHRENIPQALEIIAKMLPAKRVSFTMLRGKETTANYVWEEGAAVSSKSSGEPEGMSDLTSIPIEDADGAVCAILSAGGLGRPSACAAMLKSVEFSFAMLCSNARSYWDMKQLGENDVLTGLYNRNRYEIDLPNLVNGCRENLCCIFVDVNGLHELNNSQGHEAGDHMLRSVADKIRSCFDTLYAYRVGGDEFVIFVCDKPETETRQRILEMEDILKGKGYFVSAGYAWASVPIKDVEMLIKDAEKKMYLQKQEYYRNPVNNRRAR